MASGDVDEFYAFVPDMADLVINADDVIEEWDEEKILAKFKEREVGSYFFIEQGKMFTLYGVFIMIILPASWMFNKLCKNVRMWEDVIDSFFFNGPLRALSETYIEVCLVGFNNLRFIKMGNWSQIFCSIVAFCVSGFCLLLPFVLMNLLHHHRRVLRTRYWDSSFGTITEDFKQGNIM